MFHGAKGPLLIERIGHLLSINYGEKEERKRWAMQGISYLQEVQCTSTPYLEILVEESGLRPVSLLNSQLVGKPHFSLLGGFDENIARDIISHNFQNAIFQMESEEVPLTKRYQHLEKITQISLLCKNFKGIEEIEYNVKNIIQGRKNFDMLNSMEKDRSIFTMTDHDRQKKTLGGSNVTLLFIIIV